ncbi:NADH-quinone oxidoreductase subunit L, partial [Brevirhabdus pacifica]
AATGLGRLLGIMLIFVGGMQMVVIADDLLALLIGWEVMGACSWALIGHRWRESAPMRSANYAFVMTRAGDIGLFVALFAVFAGTGSTSYAALGQLEGGMLGVAAWGLLVAAASKSGQLPFAPWLFRAMDGPAAVSALLHSAAMVAAGVYLLARLGPDLAAAPGFAPGALAVGLATAVAGGVVAIRQTHAKKLLAGSTSAQMGLMIAAVGAGFPGVAILHLVVHAAFKAALFIAAGIAHHATGSHDLRDMALGRAMPRVALLVLPAAFSLAAVPPLAGGWSKEEILKALEAAGPVASALGVLAGGLSAAYAARFAILAFGLGREERLPVPAAARAA